MSPELREGDEDAARTWMRTVAGAAVLVGLAFVQSPGRLVADTKFDLVANPAGFLARALHMWDPAGAFGQLQNQAYGYLWPMGPFFLVGDLVQLPGWVVQRLWVATVMVVAFVGAVRLIRAMGVRSDLAALLGGFAYATSPRMLTTLGPISIEAWPSALAPWVLLPLVIGSTRGSPRRMAALSGLAIGMVGGVNAAATSAVLPLGILWLLTREPGPRRRRLMLWWPVFTALGTLWWLVPLFLLGAYSPPFLDYIETTAVTTFPTTAFDVLRGTSAWTPYIDPSLRAGHELITQGELALNSGLVLLLGLGGLVVRANPHRRYLALSLLVGVVLVSMGHRGAVQGWFAEPLADTLDGALAAIRNVHKFDPVVRLPLVVGLAWAVQAARDGVEARFRTWRREWRVPAGAGVVGIAAVGVVGAALPLLAGHLAPARPVENVPAYWDEAAAWLDQHSAETVSLLAPGSGFAQYTWGSPDDEPMQYLAESRWAVRDAVPLTPPGTIRMLDSIEERLAQGRPSAGLATFLRRAGVGHLVVRNDLAPTDDRTHPTLLHHALEESPGLALVATFGPIVGGEPVVLGERRTVIDHGWRSRNRAVEVYQVGDDVPTAVTSRHVPTVVGGPEDLLDLTDAGLIGAEPTVLAADSAADTIGGPLLLTDGMVLRERFFGRLREAAGAALGPGDERRTSNRVPDYAIVDGDRWRTTVRLRGAASLSASSSAADAGAVGGSRPGELPYAAVDGDLATAWTTDRGSERSPWWRVDLDAPRSLTRLTVVLGESAPRRTLLRVRTEAGESEIVETGPDRSRTVALPEGATSWVVVESALPRAHRLSLREVYWEGRDIRRQRVLPAPREQWGTADQVLLRADADARTGCVEVGDRVACRADGVGSSEEDERFERVVPSAGRRTYGVRLTAVPRAGTELEVALQEGRLTSVFASSAAVPDPRASGMAAMDGDLGTSWTADPEELRPRLGLSWVGVRRVGRLKLVVAPAAPVRRPTKAELTWPGGRRTVWFDRLGRTRFPAIRTDRLGIEVLESEDAVTLDDSGRVGSLPVGVSEMRVARIGPGASRPSAEVRSWPCGSGPTVRVSGQERRSRVVASPRDLYEMREVPVELCGTARDDVVLRPGDNIVVAEAGTLASPRTVLLSTSVGAGTEPQPAQVGGSTTLDRSVRVEGGQELLALRRNHNRGWVASQGAEQLEAQVVDGWQQGWILSGDEETVRVRFAPDRAYRAALLVGGGLFAALVVALLLIPRRRWRGGELPACDGSRLPFTVMAGAVVLTGGLVAGWPGVGLAAGLLVLTLGLGSRLGPATVEVAGWSLAGLIAVASVAYLLRPWGTLHGWAGGAGWVSYLVLASVLGVALSAARPRRGVANRMKGRSTSR